MGQNSDPANIGGPIGARVWIVDPENYEMLVPVGAVGELLIEGRIVARGYLDDEEMTAAQFITEPSWLPQEPTAKGRRLYKTGDLMHYNYDGTMTFVDRKDLQVKIRGQRVELGKVEHHVRRQLGTQYQVVVHAGKLHHQEDRQVLVAFLVFSACDSSSVVEQDLIQKMSYSQLTQMREVQAALLMSLPSYMVPSLFVLLRRIPLTPSSKTHRRMLQQILETMPENERDHCALLDESKLLPCLAF